MPTDAERPPPIADEGAAPTLPPLSPEQAPYSLPPSSLRGGSLSPRSLKPRFFPSRFSIQALSSLPPPLFYSILPRERAPVSVLIVITLVSFAADLASKAWATARLSGFGSSSGAAPRISVLPGHLDFVFAQNPNGAWSVARGLPEWMRGPLFFLLSGGAIVVLLSLYRRVTADQWAMMWGLPLALGGALGNFVERLWQGWCVDFIDIYWKSGARVRHWPTFNVADVAIAVGVLMMVFDMLWTSYRTRGQRRRPKALG